MSDELVYARADTIAQALAIHDSRRKRQPGYERDAEEMRGEILAFLAEARAAERNGKRTLKSNIKVLQAKERTEELHKMRIAKYGA